MTSFSDNFTDGKAFPSSLLETLWQSLRPAGSSRSGSKYAPTRPQRGIALPITDGNSPLTPEELRAVESIMGKKRPGLITKFSTPLHHNEKMEEMFRRVAKGHGADYTPEQGFKLGPVPTIEKLEQEPLFDDLDDLTFEGVPIKKNEPPKTNAFRPDGSVVEVSSGDVSKRYKNPRPGVLHFCDPDAEHTVRIGLPENFDVNRPFRFYLCRWNPEKRWLTHTTTYVFDFWYEEKEDDMPPGMPATYHLTER